MKDKLKDQLKKLGLRVRPRAVDPQEHKSGKIGFDERGDAVFEWNNDALNADGERGNRARNKALSHPGLSIMEDELPKNAPIQQNPKGLRVGYNPYESGMLAKKDRPKKTDLRALSKWVEQKRKAQNSSGD